MEFPHLGKHCNERSCKQLDFLPMKCDACSKIFCRDHVVYTSHNCPESYKKDNQIPVCPLCNLPCPLKRGDLPDIVVGRHIESDCQSDPAKERRKVYTNKCSKKGCKQKELVPVKCETCRLNYCLRHRHEQDHDCQGLHGSGKAVSNTGSAAIFRAQQSSTSKKSTAASGQSNRNSNNSMPKRSHQANTTALQGSLSEDEALARALQMSMINATSEAQLEGMTAQEREDFLLAQALSASEENRQTPTATRVAHHEPTLLERCEVQ